MLPLMMQRLCRNVAGQVKNVCYFPILKKEQSTFRTLLQLQFQQNPKYFVKKKLTSLRHWYEEFTGLDEVKIAQDRVLEAEKRFIEAQDFRRVANNKVTEIQSRLREVYSELDKSRRGEERYVSLITQEHKLMKEEKILAGDFQKYERDEREYFALLSSALKDSHDKERLQAERTKYWSIIGSILGTIIGIVGSSINNELRMRKLRRLLQDAITNSHEVNPVIESKLNNILQTLKRNDAILTQKQPSVTQEPVYKNVILPIPSPSDILPDNQQELYIGVALLGITLFLIIACIR